MIPPRFYSENLKHTFTNTPDYPDAKLDLGSSATEDELLENGYQNVLAIAMFLVLNILHGCINTPKNEKENAWINIL